ncbi:hypothetical protein C8J57DRAFT_1530107 [Mycena rebaudengoi]|nr:hypothetical protein C8J57DRAFT_1530107 [Mycena rebaudengoi]
MRATRKVPSMRALFSACTWKVAKCWPLPIPHAPTAISATSPPLPECAAPHPPTHIRLPLLTLRLGYSYSRQRTLPATSTLHSQGQYPPPLHPTVNAPLPTRAARPRPPPLPLPAPPSYHPIPPSHTLSIRLHRPLHRARIAWRHRTQVNGGYGPLYFPAWASCGYHIALHLLYSGDSTVDQVNPHTASLLPTAPPHSDVVSRVSLKHCTRASSELSGAELRNICRRADKSYYRFRGPPCAPPCAPPFALCTQPHPDVPPPTAPPAPPPASPARLAPPPPPNRPPTTTCRRSLPHSTP